jgi:hypothetical protein
MKRALVTTCIVMVALPVIILVGYQVLQSVSHRSMGTNSLLGTVVDQDEKAVAGVELLFENVDQRLYVPIPFTPTRKVTKTITAHTDSNGLFSVSFAPRHLRFLSATKSGYNHEGHQPYSTWLCYTSGYIHSATFHLFNTQAAQSGQLRRHDFGIVLFPADGQLFFNMAEGKSSNDSEYDILFRWRRLSATAEHGEYGKLVIRAHAGGIWLSEAEKLFAPAVGYQEGMVFFFDPKAMDAYMKFKRLELFLKSRNGLIHARVFAQLDMGKSALALRARVNPSGSLFVDAKDEGFGSMSPSYLNPNIPWWLRIRPEIGQIITTDDQIRKYLAADGRTLSFTRYFAAHYQTPPDMLESMISNNLSDHYVPQALAKNLGAPSNVLERFASSVPPWRSNEVQAVLSLPEDVKRFLKERD